MNELRITLDVTKRPTPLRPLKVGLGDREYPWLQVSFTDNGEKAEAGGYDATLIMKSGDEVKKRNAFSKVYDSGASCYVRFGMMGLYKQSNWKLPGKGIGYVVLEKGDVKLSTQRFEFEVIEGKNA